MVPLARLACTCLAGGCIFVGAFGQSRVLTNPLALWIGDHSYTVSGFVGGRLMGFLDLSGALAVDSVLEVLVWTATQWL